MKRHYDGRFYKQIGSYLYIVFCNGRWRWLGVSGPAALPLFKKVITEMRALGVRPRHAPLPDALRRAYNHHGATLAAWKSLPHMDLSDDNERTDT